MKIDGKHFILAPCEASSDGTIAVEVSEAEHTRIDLKRRGLMTPSKVDLKELGKRLEAVAWDATYPPFEPSQVEAIALAEACNAHDALTNENTKLREALAFYADPNNWCEIETGIGMAPSEADRDYGKKARTLINKP